MHLEAPIPSNWWQAEGQLPADKPGQTTLKGTTNLSAILTDINASSTK
jgi:hypothetical protein